MSKSMEKLTKGQEKALQAVRTGRNVCITGGGGVGKSHISRKIIEELQKDRKTILIAASTERAAMLIGGVTCHRAFNIPIKVAWPFAHTLAPETKLLGNKLIIPRRYKDQVESFIKAIGG